MGKDIENLSKLDPSEALGNDALLQVLQLIGHGQEGKPKRRGKGVEKPISDPFQRNADINPDNSVLKRELRERSKMRNCDAPNEEEKDAKGSWAQELESELENEVRKFRQLNRKKSELQ